MKSRTNQKLIMGIFALTCSNAPHEAQAADLLTRWNFENGSATPTTGPGMGGGVLTPSGTATFTGVGITGASGDNALTLTNTYNVGPGSAAATSLANQVANVGTLDSFTVTMWVNLAASSYTANQFPRLFQIGPAPSPDNVIPSLSVFMNNGSIEVGVNQSNSGRIGGPVAGDVPLNFNSSQANTWVFLAVSYDGLQGNPYYSADNGNFQKYAVRNNLVMLAGKANESVSVSGSTGVNLGNRTGNYNQSPGPVPLGTADYVYMGNRQNGERGINGSMDDVRLYRGQLTIPELNAVRLEGAPPPPDPVPAYFWTGTSSNIWGVAGNWASDVGGTPSGTPPATNGTQAVAFSALTSTNLITVLGADQFVSALHFNANSGAVEIGGTHNLTLGGGGIRAVAASGPGTINTSGQVILGADQEWKNESTNPLAVASTISGAFKLTTGGAGVTGLSGANTHASTTVGSGTLKLGNVLALGPITTSVTLNGGTLDLNNFSPEVARISGSLASTISNTAEGLATLTVNSPALSVDTYGGHINDGAPTQRVAFTKTGTGTLTVSGLGSFTGNVNVNAGTLSPAAIANGPANVSALGNAQTAGRTVTVAPGATLLFTNNNIFGNQNSVAALMPEIIVNSDEVSPGVVNSTRFNAMGKITLNGGTLSQSSTDNTALYQGYQFRSDIVVLGTRPSLISSPTGRANHLSAETIFDVADVTSNADADLIVSNPLWDQSGDHASASGSLVKKGLGTLALTVSNSYTGATRVEAGTLNISGDKSLSDTAALTVFAAAKLHIDFGSELVGSLVFRDALEVDTVQAVGTYGGPDSSATTIMPTWTGTGVILLSSDPFPVWMAGFPGYNVLSLAQRQKDGDADLDGLTNLTEFALNGSPVSGVASGKVRSRTELVSGQKALVVTIPVRTATVFTGTAPAIGTNTAAHLIYRIEASNELGTFDQAVSEVPVLEEGTLPVLDTGWIYRSFRLNGDIDGGTPRGPAGFIRVGVSETPVP